MALRTLRVRVTRVRFPALRLKEGKEVNCFTSDGIEGFFDLVEKPGPGGDSRHSD